MLYNSTQAVGWASVLYLTARSILAHGSAAYVFEAAGPVVSASCSAAVLLLTRNLQHAVCGMASSRLSPASDVSEALYPAIGVCLPSPILCLHAEAFQAAALMETAHAAVGAPPFSSTPAALRPAPARWRCHQGSASM